MRWSTRRSGRFCPAKLKPNEDTRFTYMLWPSVTSENTGFDRLRLVVPDLVRADEVEVTVAGQVVAPTAMNIAADSLLIDLPQVVQGDSVQVAFTTRLVRNAAVVDADLGLSDAARPVARRRAGRAPVQRSALARTGRQRPLDWRLTAFEPRTHAQWRWSQRRCGVELCRLQGPRCGAHGRGARLGWPTRGLN